MRIMTNYEILFCIHRPIISTENGDLKFSTTGDLVFEAGSSSTIRFQSNGQPMQPPQGFKGEKVNRIDLATRILTIANYWLAIVGCKVYITPHILSSDKPSV